MKTLDFTWYQINTAKTHSFSSPQESLIYLLNLCFYDWDSFRFGSITCGEMILVENKDLKK